MLTILWVSMRKLTKMKYEKITGDIIGAAFRVHNKLGFGFREKIYQRAMIIELEKLEYKVEEELYLNIYYDDKIIGKDRADLFVNKTILVELKTLKELSKSDEIQLVNYLNATRIEIGLLINFGQTVTIKRKFRDYKKG